MDFRNFAIATAVGAGEILMRLYDMPQTREWHTRTNFKTMADDASNTFIRNRIELVFPEHGIYSEEGEEKITSSLYRWIVDALDGTLPFTTGINDHFAVSIALCENERPIVGVIFAPKRRELYVAEEGKGAFLNGHPIQISAETEINHTIMGLDSGKRDRLALEVIHHALLGEDGVSADLKHGCASVPLALVACGRLDAYAALSLEQEDKAAAIVIIREAGGRVTTLDGHEAKISDRSILAANPVLHEKLLRRIRR